MKKIPQRELRNDIGRVLREVEAGERYRVTVNGRPVADLIPLEGQRRTWVPRDDVLRLIEEAPLDKKFLEDVDAVIGETIDEM